MLRVRASHNLLTSLTSLTGEFAVFKKTNKLVQTCKQRDRPTSVVLRLPDSLFFGLQKACGTRAAGHAQARSSEAMRISSHDTSCMPGMTHAAAVASGMIWKLKMPNPIAHMPIAH